jgi:ATP-binding cassette, subfamily B, bacterial
MAMSVTMVQFGGIGIDLIRFHVGQIDAPPTLLGNYRLPSSLTAMTQVGIAAGAMALTAIVRAVLNWAYAMISGDLVHRRIVVNLRAEVYAKLQRLSLRFYDQQATGSIINRVTGDVQATRTFIDGVLIQLSVLAMSLAVYLTFLASYPCGTNDPVPCHHAIRLVAQPAIRSRRTTALRCHAPANG